MRAARLSPATREQLPPTVVSCPPRRAGRSGNGQDPGGPALPDAVAAEHVADVLGRVDPVGGASDNARDSRRAAGAESPEPRRASGRRGHRRVALGGAGDRPHGPDAVPGFRPRSTTPRWTRRSNPHGARPRRMDEPENRESTVHEPDAAGDPGLTVPLNGDDPARVVAAAPGETISEERVVPPLPTIDDPAQDLTVAYLTTGPRPRATPRRRPDRGQVRLPPGRRGGRRRPGPAAGAGLRDPRGAGPGRYGRRLQGAQVNLNRICALKMILAGAHAGPEAAARFRPRPRRSRAWSTRRSSRSTTWAITTAGPTWSSSTSMAAVSTIAATAPRCRPSEAAELVEALARAIHYSHGLGVVHRDLKPSNILLTSDGRAKIADFGLAKMLDTDSRITGSNLILGTPSYMAPEQASGDAKRAAPSADITPWGRSSTPSSRVARRSARRRSPRRSGRSGRRPPSPVPPPALVAARRRDDHPEVPPKRPADRYATAEALAEDLRRFRAREPILARPIPAWERGLKWAAAPPLGGRDGRSPASPACWACWGWGSTRTGGSAGAWRPRGWRTQGPGGPRHRRGRDVSRPGQRRRGPPPGASLGLARRGLAGPQAGGLDGRPEAGQGRPANRRGPVPRRIDVREVADSRPRRGRPLARLQPDGRALAVADYDGHLRLWDVTRRGTSVSSTTRASITTPVREEGPLPVVRFWPGGGLASAPGAAASPGSTRPDRPRSRRRRPPKPSPAGSPSTRGAGPWRSAGRTGGSRSTTPSPAPSAA